MDWKSQTYRFVCRGLSVSAPADMLPDGKYPVLTNVRSYYEGIVQTRPGMSLIADIDGGATAAAHSIRRLNEPASVDWTRVVGAGSTLYFGKAAFTLISTGWSGNPLTMIPHRPSQSPEPWMYVADSAKMKKVRVTGTEYNWGIAAPNAAPSAALGATSYKVISDFENTTESAVAWTNGGTAGALAAAARVSTGVAAILYDSGTTGWASVKPTAFTADIQPGMFLTTAVTTAETVLVDSVYDPVFDTTISSITYDSGTSGLCSIQLTVPSANIKRDSVIFIAATEYVRVLSVTTGQNGISSIRCSTTATRAAGDAVAGVRTFRAYFANTHTVLTTISTSQFNSAVTVGTGTIGHVLARDLSSTGTSGRPITDDDEMVISIKVDDLSRLTQIQIMLDVDAATNDFTKNYFVYAIRPNDLTAALAGTSTFLTTRQQVIQREQLDRASGDVLPMFDANGIEITPGQNDDLPTHGPPDWGSRFGRLNPAPLPGGGVRPPRILPPFQTIAGAGQWSIIRIKIRDLQRIGADATRTLKDVQAIQVTFQCTNTINVSLDAWWVGGTVGLEIDEDTDPLLYRYRARSTVTGAKSNPSPPMRTGVAPQRQSVVLTTSTHSDSQVDVIDWFRTGGNLLEWHYVGSCPNTGTPSFTDEYLDSVVVNNPTLEFDNFQPFPILDKPRAGVCNIKGTTVTRTSGDTFNTSWAAGSIIILNGVAHILYASPSSTSQLEIVDSGGTQASVSFQLPSPTLLGQPVSTVFGPYGIGSGGIFMFACKDGNLYWTKGNDPDSAPDTNIVEVTNGSEVLLNGCIYDGRPYVFSDQKMYQITPIPTASGGVAFQTQEVANSKGLASKWGLCVGDKIYFIAKDGIYASEGGQPLSLTDRDLYSLFPHDGVAGAISNSYLPPDYATYSAFLRLNWGDGMLYFDYKDGTFGFNWSLVFHPHIGGWYADTYSPTIACHHFEEGDNIHRMLLLSSDGRLMELAGSSGTDVGGAINAEVKTQLVDFGDPRLAKQFSDLFLEADFHAQNVVCAVTGTVDGGGTATLNSVTLTAAAGRKPKVVELSAAVATLCTSIQVDLTWTGFVELYSAQPSFIPKVASSVRRLFDWDNLGHEGAKRINGFIIDADTLGNTRIFTLEIDGAATAQTISINHNGQQALTYEIPIPVVATNVRLTPDSSTNLWRFYGLRWLYEEYPEYAALLPDFSDLGYKGDKFLRGVVIECDTLSTNATITVQKQGAVTVASQVVNHNGRELVTIPITPVIVEEARLVPSKDWRFFGARWIYDEYGTSSTIPTAWSDVGYNGAKFLQGLVLNADTRNLPVSIQVQYDTGIVGATLAATHNGQVSIPYSFAPIIGHNFRLFPLGNCNIFDVQWVWEPEPELATTWATQATTHDLRGFQHLRDCYLSLISSATVTLTINIDGVDYAYTIPSTSGAHRKVYIPLRAAKGKMFTYTLTSASGFRLFLKDCEVHVKEWGSTVSYQLKNPFGDISRVVGARI